MVGVVVVEGRQAKSTRNPPSVAFNGCAVCLNLSVPLP
jgi:hypothetical protein